MNKQSVATILETAEDIARQVFEATVKKDHDAAALALGMLRSYLGGARMGVLASDEPPPRHLSKSETVQYCSSPAKCSLEPSHD